MALKHRGSAIGFPIGPFLVIGVVLFLVGGAWLLYGVPFEDPWQDWLIRYAVFASGLLLLIFSLKSNRIN